MLKIVLNLLILSILSVSAPVLAADILVEGRVFTEAGSLANSKVSAHRSYADLQSGAPPAATAITDVEGVYHLNLPAGSYVFTAKGMYAGKEYFAYHGSNPVKADQEKLWLALMATAIEAPPVYIAGPRLLEGVVSYKGQPVANARVTLYTPTDKTFKGLGVKAETADKDGVFKLYVPPGKYVVTARRMSDGKYNHPPQKGDLFCYYSRNPVEIKPGSTTRIAFSCYPKIDRNAFVASAPVRDASYTTLAEQEAGSVNGIPGRVVDARGKPLSGLTVTAYRIDSAKKNMPGVARSTKTDASGAFFIPLDQAGDYSVEAQGEVGITTKSYYKSKPRQVITFRKGTTVNKIVITADQFNSASDVLPQPETRH